MKRIGQLSLACWIILSCLTGCETGGVVGAKQTETYLNENTANQIEGIGGQQAFLIDETTTHVLDSQILKTSRYFTISMWVKPTANFEWTTLFSIGKNNKQVMQVATSGNPDGKTSGLNYSIQKGTAANRICSEKESTLETGVYNQVVVVGNGNLVSLYLNGQLAGQDNMPVMVKDLRSSQLVIGKSTQFDDPQLQGSFQGLTIRNTALTGDQVKNEYNDFVPHVVLETIHFNDMDDYTGDMWYPENPYRDQTIYWSSNNHDIMTDQGKFTLPSPDQGDQEFTMTARIEYNAKTYTRDFTYHVLADSATTRLKRDQQALRNDLHHLVNNLDTLPSVGQNNSVIEWSVVKGNVMIQNNQLIKTDDQEKTTATLKAVLHQENQEVVVEKEVVVLDQYTGYILSYFNGELGEEKGKLAYSTDGLHWTDLNQGNAILTSQLGNGRIRDPYIGRDKEGNFVILATEGFDNPEIYYWNSPDLVQFDDHQLISIATWDPYLNLSGTRAWAPEMVYDDQQDLYYIHFSDPTMKDESAIYYVTTKDFKTFSYPGNFFKPGYSVIDGTVIQSQGKYWLFYKDERKAAQTIYFASSTSLKNLFGKAYDEYFLFHRRFMEGPFVQKVNGENKFYLYEDYYPYGTFYVGQFSTLQENMKSELVWLNEDQFQLPNEDVRHGSSIAVTEKELQKILEAYQ